MALATLGTCEAAVRDRGSREVINYWLVAKEDGCGELDELIADAVEKEIEERKDDAGYLIWLIDRIAGLLNEAGLYRELLLPLRTTSLELEEATEGRDEEWILSSLDWLAKAHRKMGNYNEAEPLYLRCLEAQVPPGYLGCLLVNHQAGSELLWGVIVETEAEYQ